MLRRTGISARLNLLAGLVALSLLGLIVVTYSVISEQSTGQRELVAATSAQVAAQALEYDFAQQNASASEELAATAEEMSAQTSNLQQLMRFFTVDARRAGDKPNPVRSGAIPQQRAGAAAAARTGSPDLPIFDDASFERF